MTDTYLQRISRDELPDDYKLAWDTLNKLTGDATFVEVFANAPELLNFVMNEFYMKIFFQGRVENKYKQFVRLRLSLLHGCRTCNMQNVPGALEAGISQEQVDAIENYQSGPFDDKEKAVLSFAEQMALTNMDGRMDEELYNNLHTHFSDAEICELGTVMAVIAGMAKLSFVMDLVIKEDYCPFAPETAAA